MKNLRCQTGTSEVNRIQDTGERTSGSEEKKKKLLLGSQKNAYFLCTIMRWRAIWSDFEHWRKSSNVV